MLPRCARSSPTTRPCPWSRRASAYAAAMGALHERYRDDAEAPILGLSGSVAEIAAVAKEYRVFFRKAPGALPRTI